MTPQTFYKLIYSVLKNHTPLKGDCGIACNKACCRGDKDGDGMYLFPFEEAMYADIADWFSISETDFEYSSGKFAPLFACDGTCNRTMRPLACRIFPLTPYVTKDGNVITIVDPRANGMCPLSGLSVDDFDNGFVAAVDNVGKILMKNTNTREFLISFSRMLDDMNFL